MSMLLDSWKVASDKPGGVASQATVYMFLRERIGYSLIAPEHDSTNHLREGVRLRPSAATSMCRAGFYSIPPKRMLSVSDLALAD
jgi:hypothetical protein